MILYNIIYIIYVNIAIIIILHKFKSLKYFLNCRLYCDINDNQPSSPKDNNIYIILFEIISLIIIIIIIFVYLCYICARIIKKKFDL